ncbi:L-arabinose isomerase (plasmid) [Gemmatirosa kalamazoonensis]|uniref:L-arabinose isomerase n=1 Tax=Gemmatirosa kalamazoonensis TaxID=861299 RepID=W0RQ98_9BACT|nr:L-arabinose isomerase [Gemmatirosa kalamazoonensis]AHG92652.1 L-arabinose isomerase [Gemmatirosa kalamazoonensis]
MIDLQHYEVWLATGSQHLYGPETLERVAEHARAVAAALDAAPAIPVRVVHKPVLKSPDEIHRLVLEANAAPGCVGIVAWMHTFSPAKMWIGGLRALQKPLAHLHTQFNRDLPWADIDMDFMNLNQSAHGDREFGFIGARMRLDRKVIVGHWEAPDVQASLGAWTRAACAWHDAQGARFARFGDNMREVAVTEGDKVAAQLRLGYSVNGFGVGDLARYVTDVADADIDAAVAQYDEQYAVASSLRRGGDRHDALRDGARLELGLRRFLEAGGFKGFTTTFEDLHGLAQLPGLGPQRLMAEGYGFAAEGDWKTAALVRAMKVMSAGLTGGTSFMEDYTYHLHPDGQKVLGAHMLEICPSIATSKPSLEVHPLSIGGKADPVRLVFDAKTGPAVNASVVEMGDRYRMIVNVVDVVPTDEPLPKLPVARALWRPRPDLATSAAAWIYAGGAHHTGLSLDLTTEHLADFAEMAGMELLVIDEDTTVREFKKELRWNDVYYRLAR